MSCLLIGTVTDLALVMKEHRIAASPLHRIALVSNIDDDLLRATPVPGGMDLVCTAERARGYKPDGSSSAT